MQHDNNLAEIWRSAQLRRTQDIRSLFTHSNKRQPTLKSPAFRPQYSARRALALLWRFLNAARAVSRATH
jgi:hypothetical protein